MCTFKRTEKSDLTVGTSRTGQTSRYSVDFQDMAVISEIVSAADRADLIMP
jgi:hypothetical protein